MLEDFLTESEKGLHDQTVLPEDLCVFSLVCHELLKDAYGCRDFVSNYAQTDAAEDFAETVRFIVDLQTQSRPTGLSGPVTDTLRGKLLKASEVIGSDPGVLEVLPGW